MDVTKYMPPTSIKRGPSMKNNKRFQKVFAMLMSFLLTAESVGFMTQGDTGPADGAVKLQSGEAASWAASIPDLLAAGEYEEGVVIAGIDMSGAGRGRSAGRGSRND